MTDLATPRTAAADFALDEGPQTIGDSISAYIQKVRGGDLGALPAVSGFVVLCAYFGLRSEFFFTARNFANLLTQSSATIVIAMGLVFVLLLGEIDLSAGTTAGVCAAILAVQLRDGTSMPVAVAMAIVAGVAIGVFTGFLVARIGIPSFVVTLALFLAWQGVILKIIGEGGNIPINDSFINGIVNKNMSPLAGWIFYAVCITGYAAVLLIRWRGRRARHLGGEPLATILAKIAVLAVLGAIAVSVLNVNRNPGQAKVLQGIPYVVPVILVLLVILTFVLGRTPYGRHLYAVGGNTEAARRAGIGVIGIRLSAFVMCSSLAAFGGIVLASRLNSVDPQTGGGNQLLFAVGAAVIGGTSLFGGRGKIRDAILGGLVIAVIDNGLGLLKYDSGSKFIATGLVLLVAASVDAITRRNASAR